ncbi:Peroxin 13, N-terminal region-domain-containing protein [Ganoderma leucocontextum]|nr:Peroxin 13, N-terminal region-domain-containing protein [Ganoderma leucocontextum]
MPSPPKPWERGGTTVAAATTPTPATTTIPLATSAAASTFTPSTSAPPSVPVRPAALSAATASAFPTSTTALNSSFSSPYSSPYRYGSTYGSSSYSPYGMNSMYGGMGYGGYGGGGYGGGGYGGYGMSGMYGGMPGMPGMYGGIAGPGGPFDPNNPSLGQSLESTTQHTFALLHSIVQTFSGVAQMLESTFMATHSSFFAMVGVVEQFGQLRNALGSVLGLFGLVRWMRDLVTGRSSQQGAMRGEFRDFINGRPVQGPQPPAPKASRKPLIIFLLAIFGVPYAMHKLIKVLTERQQQQQAQMVAGQAPGGPLPPLDPSQLTFARALYPFDASSQAELSLKENEIVAIMGKLDPATGAEVDPRIEVEGSEWWKGRTREGREGWFPKKWVQVLERRKPIENGEAKKVE